MLYTVFLFWLMNYLQESINNVNVFGSGLNNYMADHLLNYNTPSNNKWNNELSARATYCNGSIVFVKVILIEKFTLFVEHVWLFMLIKYAHNKWKRNWIRLLNFFFLSFFLNFFSFNCEDYFVSFCFVQKKWKHICSLVHIKTLINFVRC